MANRRGDVALLMHAMAGEDLTAEDRADFEARIRALGYRPDDLVWAAP